jgi:hypothetical protein
MAMQGNLTEGYILVQAGIAGMRKEFVSFALEAKAIGNQPLFSNAAEAQIRAIGTATKETTEAKKDLNFKMREAGDAADKLQKSYEALLNTQGQSIEKLQFEIEYLDKYGVAAASATQAALAFRLAKGDLKDLSEEKKRAALEQAIRVDSLAQAKKDAEDFAKFDKELQNKATQEVSRQIGERYNAVIKGTEQLKDDVTKIYVDMISDDRQRAYASLEIEKQKWTRLISIARDGSDERKAIEEQYAAWLQANVTKIEVDHWKTTMDYGRQTITNLITDWSGGLKKIGQDIKTYLVDALARLAMQQWVIPIVANITGTSTGVLNAAMGVNNSPIGNIFGAGSSIGNLFGVGTGSIFGGSAAYGAALGTTSIGAGSQAAMLAAQTGEFGAAGVGATASAAGGAAGGATSFLAAAGPYVAAAAALYAIYNALKKPGGPKEGGSYIASYGATGDLTGTSSNRLYTPNSQDAQAKSLGSGIAATFYEQLKALGGTVGSTSFGIGFDADPKGTAGSRIKNQVSVNGQQVYSVMDRDVGRDPAALQSALQQESSRAILAALQASTLPPMIAGILNSISASSATEQEIDAVLARAHAMQDLFGTLGDAIDVNLGTKVKSAIEQLDDQGAALVRLARSSDNSAESIGRVAVATAQYRASVTQLIASYQEAKGAIGKTIDDAIRGYKYGNLDKQGQYNMLQSEAAGLYKSIGGLTDASAIKDVINQIVSTSGQAYGLLDPEEKKQKEAEFIAGLQGARDEANKRLIELQTAAADQANSNTAEIRDIFTRMADHLDNVAAKDTANTNNFAGAVNTFSSAVNRGVDIRITSADVAIQSGA